MGSPQFQIDETLLSQLASASQPESPTTQINLGRGLLDFGEFRLDPVFDIVLHQLRIIFTAQNQQETSARLSIATRQDLASTVLHIVLPLSHSTDSGIETIAESIRFATCIYMFSIHGPTYYSDLAILKTLTLKLKDHLIPILPTNIDNSLRVWLLSVGLVGSIGTEANSWFVTECSILRATLNLQTQDDIRAHLERVLWLDDPCAVQFLEQIIQPLPYPSLMLV